jgi:hypothetical protein
VVPAPPFPVTPPSASAALVLPDGSLRSGEAKVTRDGAAYLVQFTHAEHHAH